MASFSLILTMPLTQFLVDEACRTLGFETSEARVIEVAMSALSMAKHAESQTGITRVHASSTSAANIR